MRDFWETDKKYYYAWKYGNKPIWCYSVINNDMNCIISLNKNTGTYRLPVCQNNYRYKEIEGMMNEIRTWEGVDVKIKDNVLVFKTKIPDYICMIAFDATIEKLCKIEGSIFSETLTKSALKN